MSNETRMRRMRGYIHSVSYSDARADVHLPGLRKKTQTIRRAKVPKTRQNHRRALRYLEQIWGAVHPVVELLGFGIVGAAGFWLYYYIFITVIGG